MIPGVVAGKISGAWSTAFIGEELYPASPGWGGYTLRQVLGNKAVAPGSKVRFTLAAADMPAVITSAHVGNAAASGDPYDFSELPTRVTFSGANGCTIPASGEVVTDDIPLLIPVGARIIFASSFSSGNLKRFWASDRPDVRKWEKVGADDATVNAAGYGNDFEYVVLVKRVEIFSP